MDKINTKTFYDISKLHSKNDWYDYECSISK